MIENSGHCEYRYSIDHLGIMLAEVLPLVIYKVGLICPQMRLECPSGRIQ